MKNPPKDKVKEWNARYYQKTKDVYKERKAAQAKALREASKAVVLAYKLEHPCIICGEDDPIVLDFHHINPDDKDTEVSQLLGLSLRRLENEIAKCVLVCANCHRRIHAGVVSMEAS